MRFFAAVAGSSRKMLRIVVRHRQLLVATTRVELAKRHAGSVLGLTWVVLQPALLLSVYVFVYMVVFKIRFPGFSQFDYVLYVFCGLVPYLGFMEALTTGMFSIKQNMHLVKNVMLPIELIPIRSVVVGMTSQFVSIGLVLILVLGAGVLSWQVLWLPVIVVLQMMWLAGLTWILASLAVALPDITYFVNLFVFLLMFVSPIGFKPEMVPPGFGFIVRLNPIYYMTEMYRDSILNGRWPAPGVLAVYVAMCAVTFALGAAFFERFKGALADFE